MFERFSKQALNFWKNDKSLIYFFLLLLFYRLNRPSLYLNHIFKEMTGEEKV